MPRKLHLFLSCDGNLYDTRVQDWANHPLRTNFMVTHRDIKTAADLKATLRAGKRADGGYPLFFVMANGEVASFDAVNANLRDYLDAFMGNDFIRRANRVVGCDINYEDNDLYCDVTGEKIESAYGDD